MVLAGPAAALEDVLQDPDALAEWERFCNNYADGKYEHARPPTPPAVIRAVLHAEQTSDLASSPSYLKNQYGRPETPAELLEFYRRNGHFHAPVPSNNREARRAAVIRRYGLDDYKRQGFINESEPLSEWLCWFGVCGADSDSSVAGIARSYFRQTVRRRAQGVVGFR